MLTCTCSGCKNQGTGCKSILSKSKIGSFSAFSSLVIKRPGLLLRSLASLPCWRPRVWRLEGNLTHPPWVKKGTWCGNFTSNTGSSTEQLSALPCHLPECLATSDQQIFHHHHLAEGSKKPSHKRYHGNMATWHRLPRTGLLKIGCDPFWSSWWIHFDPVHQFDPFWSISSHFGHANAWSKMIFWCLSHFLRGA